MAERPVPDADVRARALDPARSFLVQAPAGSGKTELLIQRVLALLARVEAPEEIVAITFTRKAAAEMRARVLRALAAATELAEPEAAHARRTRALARAVLARDARKGWGLLGSPQRLRIQTIDAFCAGLGRQLPWLSGLGGAPQLTEDATPLYREAARAALATLETDGADGDAVARAVAHRDAHLEGLESLVVALLAKRDQWLRHLHHDDDAAARRARLERTVHAEVTARLAELRTAFPGDALAEACAVARDAVAALDAHGIEPGSLGAWRDRSVLPGVDTADLPAWAGLAALLLTDAGTWRKSLTVKQGFPAPSGVKGDEKARREAHKARMGTLLESLRDDARLATRLADVAGLPAPAYAEAQWEVMEAIARLLVLAAGHLKLVFAAHGRVDFSEVAQCAHAALVEDGAPTDLALALDYRIAHLLVDEFQDTSRLQCDLLARLTDGWSEGDGRTLFLVGDPMQSIYRFREAEVGLFLQAAEGGLFANVALEPLRLRANFRSDAGLVDWVNGVFPGVLAPVPDALLGAVPYASADAVREAGAAPAVRVHPRLERDDAAEAAEIVALVRAAREEDPGGTVAVLVRGRTHLHALLPQLRAAGLRYRAVDVEPLDAQPVVEGLWALTRALLHRGDRVAWLALLRGPLCGLTLADLLAFAGDAPEAMLPARLDDPAVSARLTLDGQARVARLADALAPARAALGRAGLRRLVEGAWLALGGPALADATARQAAEAYLDLLDLHATGGTLPDPDAFAEALAELHAPADPGADASLQLMTVHKAKGLEFDTVIVPGLGRLPRRDDPPLLAWLETPDATDGLLMAPIDARGAARDPLYKWIRRLEEGRAAHEGGRLLYVAATRARRRLHLLGAARIGTDRGRPVLRAPKRSFLELLWPALQAEYEALMERDGAPGDAAEGDAVTTPVPSLTRLPRDWHCPAFPAPVAVAGAPPEAPVAEAVIFDWAGEGARAAGTVVHRLLEAWDRDGLPDPGALPEEAAGFVRAALREQGLSGAPLDAATTRVERALRATLADPRGRWLFDPAHAEARSELALTAELDGRLVDLVIDRTFVDADGVRWIVDFKTSDHGGGGLDAFLDREQERYRGQLERYGAVLARLDPRPQRLALYFPLVGGWREWTPPA